MSPILLILLYVLAGCFGGIILSIIGMFIYYKIQKKRIMKNIQNCLEKGDYLKPIDENDVEGLENWGDTLNKSEMRIKLDQWNPKYEGTDKEDILSN